MTTDPTPLQERIARAMYARINGFPGMWERLTPEFQQEYLDDAAAVLPIIRKAQADALRDAADSVHDNAASPHCLPCHRDDADLLRTIAATIEKED